MIYTRFHGRTGNQMFQYAAARGLAAFRGSHVVIDDRLAIRRGERSITRIFDLPVVTPARMPPARHARPVAHFLWRHLGHNPAYRREAGLGYNPDFPNFPGNSYLHGYWQSERYFAHVADDLRRDFTFPPPSPRNAELGTEIADTLAVSVHLRRGDYVGNAAYAVCGQAYYDAALKALLPRIDGSPVFYVFSDDPDWARENLSLPGRRVVVDHNGEDADHEDMRLMSLCRHNVIANSSFSWWGAWLNRTPDRIVAAPARWFGDGTRSNPDIYPPDWLRIEPEQRGT